MKSRAHSSLFADFLHSNKHPFTAVLTERVFFLLSLDLLMVKGGNPLVMVTEGYPLKYWLS